MSKKFKVAVVGCGNRGLTYASEMFAKGDVYEIVALCETNPKQLEKMKNVLPLKNVSEFNHPNEFFKEKRADIVIIASLIIAGLILFIIEVFLLPGVSIAGIISAICLLYAN